MANTLFFLIAIPLPAILAWTTLWFTHDAIITMIVTGGLGLLLPIIVYDKWVGDFSFERKIPDEIMNKEDKISLGIKLGLGAAFGVAIFLALWSMFLPEFFGPTSITLPFPVTDGALKYTYLTFFVLSYLIFAALEHIYFNYFTSIEYTEKEGLASFGGEKASFSSNFVISIGNALMHFAVFYWTIKPLLFWAIIYGAVAFFVNFVVISVRHNKKLIVSILFKVGIALGVLLYLWYLSFTLGGDVKRITPTYYFTADVENSWGNWFAGDETTA
jgi:hypothetical protein